MCERYQSFRSIQLENLKTHSPHLTYRQRLKIISDLWKDEKNKQIQDIIPPNKLSNYVSQTSPSEESLRKIKQSVESIDPETLLEMKDGDNHVFMEWMCWMIRNYPERFVIQVLQRFIYHPCIYEMTYQSLSLVEISVFYEKEDVLFFLLTKASSEWVDKRIFKSTDKSMLSCLFHTLLKKVDQCSLKEELVNWVRKALSRGIDPNLELSPPHDMNGTMDIWYMGCSAYEVLYKGGCSAEHVKKFVKYSCLEDPSRSFRERSSGLPPSSSCLSGVLGVRGDTLFSVFYRMGKDYRSKCMIRKLIESKTLNWTMIFLNNKVVKTECYLTMMLSGTPREILDEAFLGYFKTPPYMYYMNSSGSPLKKLREFISHHWAGQLCSLPNIPPVLFDMFIRGFLPTTRRTLSVLSMNPEMIDRILSIVEARGSWRDWIHNSPSLLNTCFSKLLLTPHGLQFILETPDWKTSLTKPLMISLAEIFIEENIQAHLDIEMEFSNEWFINGDDVKDSVGKFPLYITDDKFAFCQEDVEYLLENPLNPYTRKEFTLNETLRLEYMNRLYDEWWFLMNLPPKFDDMKSLTELKISYLTEKIDQFIEDNPYFVYGERLTNMVSKFDSMEKIHATYLCLLSTPTILSLDAFNPLLSACVPFRTNDDCFQVEMINIYYGMKIIVNPSENTLQKMVRDFLSWILCILECTSKYETNEKLNGRIFSLYIILTSFVNRLGSVQLQPNRT
jgi:hypothetical protein